MAIETLANSPAADAVFALECAETRQAVNIERAVLARLGGDCTMPFGCLVTNDKRTDHQLFARAIVLDSDGKSAKCVREIRKDLPNIDSAFEELIIDELRKNNANDILARLGIAVRI